jgi:hypothetical protein
MGSNGGVFSPLRSGHTIVAGLKDFFLGLGRAAGEVISIGDAFRDRTYILSNFSELQTAKMLRI